MSEGSGESVTGIALDFRQSRFMKKDYAAGEESPAPAYEALGFKRPAKSIRSERKAVAQP